MADRDDYWFFQSQTAPTPLAGAQGEAWWLLWGNVKDGWREAAREATKASLPAFAAVDSLGAYAAERGTESYPTETEASYRVRLAETFDRYAFLGTPTGVNSAVIDVPGVTSVIYREAWQWDAGSPLWARFWLVCATTYAAPPSWGDAGLDFGDPELIFGLTAARDTIDFLRRQIERWRAAHARLVWCALLIGDAHVFGDPDISWGDPGLTFDAGSIALLES